MSKTFLFLASLFNLISASNSAEPANFALFTMPKSGSHLLIKTLYLMTGLTPQWHSKPPRESTFPQEGKFPYTHICISPSLQNYYSNAPSLKQIIAVRDLRDVCVSIVHQIKKGYWPEITNKKSKHAAFQNLSFDDQLLWVINQEYRTRPRNSLQLGISKVAEQALTFMQNPDVFICRFEDLIGPQGGGSEEKQYATIHQLGVHLGIDLTPQEVQTLAGHLFGDEMNPFGQGEFENYQSTFREGKIGTWKTCFKEQHKAAFKKRLGPTLISLGYEEDNNW